LIEILVTLLFPLYARERVKSQRSTRESEFRDEKVTVKTIYIYT